MIIQTPIRPNSATPRAATRSSTMRPTSGRQQKPSAANKSGSQPRMLAPTLLAICLLTAGANASIFSFLSGDTKSDQQQQQQQPTPAAPTSTSTQTATGK